MGFRFSKRIKIAPGIKLNVGLGGASISAGVRGASINIGKRGIYANAGIPGTGLSYSQKISGSGRLREDRREAKRLAKEIAELEQLDRVSKISLSLDDNGSLIIKGKNGALLEGKDLKLAHELNAKSIYNWLEFEADKINGDSDLIENIHLGSCNINDFPEFNTVDFSAPFPEKPTYLTLPLKPKYSPPRKIPKFLSWIKFLTENHANRLKKYDDRYAEKLQKYNIELSSTKSKNNELKAKYETLVSLWDQKKESHNSQQESMKNEFNQRLRNDEQFMNDILEQSISDLDWPRETILSYEFRDSCNEIVLDIDLPEIEHLPNKLAKVSANGKKLNIKNKPLKDLQNEYLMHICGIALRSACCVFGTLPSVSKITLSGFSQRLNAGTGKVVDDYLYSVRFTRDGLERLDFNALENINPVETIKMFDHRMLFSSTGLIKPISPFE